MTFCKASQNENQFFPAGILCIIMKPKAFAILHLSVFLFGFTAILGDLIHLNTLSIVWWRVFVTITIMSFLIRPWRILKENGLVFIKRHTFIGFLVALHWLAFYGSIKFSSASIALITMSTSAIITALLEPIILRRFKWKISDVIISLLVTPAMVLIYYNADQIQQTGLLIGLISAFIGAVFSILNKIWLVKSKELHTTFVQLGTVWLTTGVILLLAGLIRQPQFEWPIGIDWLYLLIFAIVCTIIAYYFYLMSMRWLSAFDVSFAFNMEPVYGLLMAAWILGDHKTLSPRVYLGMLIIFVLMLLHTFLRTRKNNSFLWHVLSFRKKPESN